MKKISGYGKSKKASESEAFVCVPWVGVHYLYFIISHYFITICKSIKIKTYIAKIIQPNVIKYNFTVQKLYKYYGYCKVLIPIY